MPPRRGAVAFFCRMSAAVGLDPRLLDDRAPFHRFGADESAEFRGVSVGLALEAFNYSMRITAITMREKAVLPSIISQVTPSESSVTKKVAYEPLFLSHLRDHLGVKGIKRVVMHEILSNLRPLIFLQFAANAPRTEIWRGLHGAAFFKGDCGKICIAVNDDIDPDNPDAILGTATALAGSEGIDRAVAYLQDEVQKGRGTRVELLCGIASLLIQKGGLDQAQELIDQGKRLRPEAAQPWKAEAELMLARGSDRKWKQKADDAYRAYLDRNPGDAAVLYERFRILMELEKYEPADLVLGDIYQSYPKFPSLHYAKGLIYMRLSNYQLAIREFEQEVKNGNGSTQNLLELGKANLELKNVEAALGYFVRAIQQSPKASEPKLQAGRANFALGRYDAAVALYQEAIKVDSGNPAIYRNLGYAYRAMGDYGSARGAFSKYLEMEPDAADKAEIQQNL